MLVTGRSILKKAQIGGYAVGAFNFTNMEILQAIIAAAERMQSPVIVQTTEGAIDYAGISYLTAMAHAAAKKAKVPVALHLDHGKGIDYIRQAISNGYTSVMVDGSHLPFEKNLQISRKVAVMAHGKKISVEAELGTLGGIEDNVSGVVGLTDPSQAKDFAKRTGIDSLAIAIGTSHGAYKFKGASKLDFRRLSEIRSLVDIPLVLHGASGIPQDIVKKAVKYGAALSSPNGVSDAHIRRAIKEGICKVNVDSDLRLTYTASLREILSTRPEIFDPRALNSPARDAITKTVAKKISVLGSAGKA